MGKQTKQKQVDWKKVEKSPNVIVVHSHRGGHCSFYENLLPFGNTYGDRVTLAFVSAVAETHYFESIVKEALVNNNNTV